MLGFIGQQQKMERRPPLLIIEYLIGIGSSDIIRISKEVFLHQVFGLTDIQIWICGKEIWKN